MNRYRRNFTQLQYTTWGCTWGRIILVQREIISSPEWGYHLIIPSFRKHMHIYISHYSWPCWLILFGYLQTMLLLSTQGVLKTSKSKYSMYPYLRIEYAKCFQEKCFHMICVRYTYNGDRNSNSTSPKYCIDFK